jgi:hypothetical protein
MGFTVQTSSQPSPLILQWISGFFETFELVLVPGDHEQATVWSVIIHKKPAAILKKHHVKSSAQNEMRSYEFLEKRGLERVPVILGTCPEDPHYLLMTLMVGGPLARTPKEFGAAGQWLRDLHGMAFEDADRTPVGMALEMRLAAIDSRVGADVSQRDRECIADHLDESIVHARVWCHRDYRSRNWIVSPGSLDFNVIDFGQSRPDLWLIDWVHARLETRDEPRLWAAFVEGYGRQLDERNERLFLGLIGLTGLASLVWARRHGHQGRREEGDRYLSYFRDRVGSQT